MAVPPHAAGAQRGPSAPLPPDPPEGSLAAGCARCRRRLTPETAYVLGAERRCLRCALRHRPLLRRSALTAIVVGTLLVGINQGTLIFTGQFPLDLVWKIPLTYAVPFCVATWGALGNARTRASADQRARAEDAP